MENTLANIAYLNETSLGKENYLNLEGFALAGIS